MSKALAVLALTLPAANAAYSWTKGTKICAGIKEPCSDKATCSATAVGPCPDGAAKPTAYLESQFEGMAFVNSKTYLDPKSGTVSDAKTYKIIEASGPGFRDYKAEIKTEDGGKFGFTMVGNVFGDTTKAGGYAGLVSYLNTGTTTLETNTAEVFGAQTGDTQKDRKTTPTGRSFLQPPNTTKANALTTFFFFSLVLFFLFFSLFQQTGPTPTKAHHMVRTKHVFLRSGPTKAVVPNALLNPTSKF